jgi:multidrug efflux pump
MFSQFFINKPIFAAVLSILIVIAGLVSMKVLPIAQYPSITPVQIQVSTTYPGADAETVGNSVAAPIEAQINGVENMLYMTSTSSNTGQMSITVYFALDTNPDIAQVLVQNRVNLALPQLPNAVKQFGVSVQKKSASILMIIGIFDKLGRYSKDYVSTYANVYILDAIKRVNGAGQAQIFGQPDQAMRIWMNPDQMASLKITTSDVQNAVSLQNAQFGAGQVGQAPNGGKAELTFPVITESPFVDPSQYDNIILRANLDGSAIVRLKDVARTEVGKKQYIDDNRLNSIPMTPIAVFQQPGANGLSVSQSVRATMEKMKQTMPDGIDYIIALDTTDFVKLSIEEVIKTLLEAVALVILVVYLFLQNFRATVICTIAIFISLIGTFSGMLLLGFSINLLTLFGLVLAIGIVVDDAILVVENVERTMAQNHNLSAKEAVSLAMHEVSGPIVASVLVISAVFIPAAFLPGTTGQLYKQFAITIAISVAISGFIALTLCPALCGVMLKHFQPKETGFFAWFNRSFNRMTTAYGSLLGFIMKRSVLFLSLLGLMLLLTGYLFKVIPGSFIPNEDQGYVLGQLILPDAASLNRTSAASSQIEAIFKENPAVLNRTVINGYSLIDSQYKSNMATFFVTLKDFKERYADSSISSKQSAPAVLGWVGSKVKDLDAGIFIPIQPPAIPGIGTTGGFEFWIQDMGAGEPGRLYEVTQNFLQKAREKLALTGLSSTFRASSLQLKADVDREKALLLDVPVSDVYSTMQAQFGSLQVSQYDQYSRTWNVILQSDADFRQTPADITRLYTRSTTMQMIPLSALVKTHYSNGPDLVPHFNGFPAALITGNAASGYSSGDAIKTMEELAKEELPSGYGFAWSGMAFQEIQSGNSSTIAFIFGIIIVFLILAAQYESWSLPFSVLTAIPFGIIGALMAVGLRGLSNDVYFQIGLLLLVGLAAKNAILIVEFASNLHSQGKPANEAAIEAGELRLRPIIMTSLAFIFGVLPLCLATGAGANARHSIGTGIFGGMIGASSLALLYVPLFFYLFDRLLRRKKD